MWSYPLCTRHDGPALIRLSDAEEIRWLCAVHAAIFHKMTVMFSNRRGHVRDAEQGSFVRMRVQDGVLVGEVDPTFDFES